MSILVTIESTADYPELILRDDIKILQIGQTVNGIAYYRSVSANAYNVLSNKILEMLLIPTSTSYPLPSQTEIDEYNKIDFIIYNDEDNKIYWYAKEQPSANVKVKIIGIKNVITSQIRKQHKSINRI